MTAISCLRSLIIPKRGNIMETPSSTVNKTKLHLLGLILYSALLYVMVILTTNRSVINQGDGLAPFLSDKEYFLAFLLGASLLVFLLILAKRSFGIRPRNQFIILWILFGLVGSVPIIYQAVLGNLNNFWTISRYISYVWLLGGAVVYTLECFPKMANGTYLYSLVAIGIILTALYGCIYSYINEASVYKKVYECFISGESFSHVRTLSFTSNKNVYGWLLVMGQISACYLQTRKFRFINFLLNIFFFANTIFTMSKASILISLCVVIIFGIYRFFACIKKKPLMVSGGALLIIIFLGIASYAVFLAPNSSSSPLAQHVRYFFDWITQRAVTSFNGRVSGTSYMWDSLKGDPMTVLFGFGYTYWNIPFYKFMNTSFYPVDMTCFMVLLENGVVGLAFSIATWIYVLVIVIKAMKQGMKGGTFFLLAWIMFLARSFAESADFLCLDVFGVVLYLLVYLPPASYLAHRKALKAEKKEEDIIVSSEKKLSVGPFYAFAAPLFALGLAFYPTYGLKDHYLLVNMILCYVLVPMLLDGFYYAYKKRNKEISMVVGSTFSLLYLVSAIIVPFFIKDLFGCLIPLIAFVPAIILYHVVIDKDILVGQWKKWIYYLLLGSIIGCIFLTINYFHFASLSTFAIVFMVIDIIVITLGVDLTLSSWSYPLLYKGENVYSRCMSELEKREVTGIHFSREKREAKYQELNIYNL